ncbi:hypothetical protein UlMin_007954 [Ulmus minor]
MGLLKISWVILLFCVLGLFCFKGQCDGSDVSVKFLKTPHAFSHRNSAIFVFDILLGGNGSICSNCSSSCKLDGGIASNCETRKVSYSSLNDGNHTFEVCTNGLQGVGCTSYNWTIDTVAPTAYVTTSNSFTNALNFSVNISFTEPCTGGGGFSCLSANACNLLVYGAGQVIPTSLNVLQPNLTYSLFVSLSPKVEYGRVILVMDKDFCTDNAGNRFIRTENSSFVVHVDRRKVFVNMRIRIPDSLVQLNGQTRTVLATNNFNHLKVYLYFSETVLNSTAEIQNSLNINQGSLLPTSGETLGNRRFGFLVENISGIAIITASFNSNLIITRQGTPVSPIAPVTFLYDSQRPSVMLSTSSDVRTREHNIPISIKFVKPVFGFNSSYVSVSGGHVQSFHQISRSNYIVDIRASDDVISVNVPENVTSDVAGNKNLPSNVLQVKHYSTPLISSVISAIVTASFLTTSLAAGTLTFSTASLQTLWAFQGAPSLTTDAARNLFRIACHIQVFALSRWLAVMLPVEYYEFSRALQWSIPYFDLPWENFNKSLVMVGSSPFPSSYSYISKIYYLENSQSLPPEEVNSNMTAPVYGLPLDPMEYRFYFENQNIKPEAEFLLDAQNLTGWKNFSRSMFWLAVIGGGLVMLHVLLIFLLKLKKKMSENQKGYGALTFPRFEIFLIILALPCVSEVSATLLKGKDSSEVIVGFLVLGFVSFLLLVLFFFLSLGITFGKLLQYKEVHKEGRRFHWYQELVRVTLGPGKRGQWTWKRQANSLYLIILGPLFEDLRGPPKYMLSQIAGGNPHKHGDRIIASDDETEDAEAPFIQKLFGILRIYYTLLECLKRVCLGIMAGLFMENWSSKTPSIILLCITSFQLFFMVLKKPFIKKKLQLVEIISVSCEVGLFATCVALSFKKFSAQDETKVGIFLIILFLVGYVSQLINEWYALYRYIMRLNPADKSFIKGLKIASIGCILLFLPSKLIKNLESRFSPPRQGQSGDTDTTPEAFKHSSRSSSTSDKPWLKQLREMAKASFSKEGTGASNDPSSSRTGWSGIRGIKRSGSSSLSSPADSKSKPSGLYKDLEAIFASI